jgi:ADP-L-glycero-D-manno-heptose 6-epimerase
MYYIITGAAGFIGSVLISELNRLGHKNIIAVDDFSYANKQKNLEGKTIQQQVERKELFQWLQQEKPTVTVFFHIGARTDTTEFDTAIFDELNVNYSKQVWKYCTEQQIPLIYASSAATYGNGELGYDDNEALIPQLKPLNPYGVSKQQFDEWVLQQKNMPPCWYGLKFFNVYGPNEYHKGRMASVIFHAFHQIQQSGSLKLFRSHNPNYTDGGQMRDFIYVKDLVSVCLFLAEKQPKSGIYNLGTGKARKFLDLANAVFEALEKTPQITFIDTPADIRDKYQYFTEANMSKLKAVGYEKTFYSLEEGVKEYVTQYLKQERYY